MCSGITRHLISDNASGVHPEVLRMIHTANVGHAVAYGEDEYTRKAREVFRSHFGETTRAYFVGTGTAANILALQSVTQSFEAVICADSSHLHRDECGAPEKILGSKTLIAPAVRGKITTPAIQLLVQDANGFHRVQPRVVSISQPTEYGTVYTPEEVRSLADFCHQNGLFLHVDGARLSNAAASLNLTLRDMTTALGVDLLSFGGTKNGLLAAEAVVVLTPASVQHVEFYQKQSMHLLSKMRFVSAQFLALLGSDLWLKNAHHANAMAKLLAVGASKIPDVQIIFPPETNAIFARIPRAWVDSLQSHSRFHVWDSQTTTVRWMTSFDTQEIDIEDFVRHLESCQRGGTKERDESAVH